MIKVQHTVQRQHCKEDSFFIVFFKIKILIQTFDATILVHTYKYKTEVNVADHFCSALSCLYSVRYSSGTVFYVYSWVASEHDWLIYDKHAFPGTFCATRFFLSCPALTLLWQTELPGSTAEEPAAPSMCNRVKK